MATELRQNNEMELQEIPRIISSSRAIAALPDMHDAPNGIHYGRDESIMRHKLQIASRWISIGV